MANPNAIPMAPEAHNVPAWQKALQWVVILVLSGSLLFLATLMYSSGDVLFASAMIALAGVIGFVYLNPRIYVARYLLPGLALIGLFSIFPLSYTVLLSFTNYSSSNLISFDRAKATLLRQTYTDEGGTVPFELYPAANGQFRLVIHYPEQSYASAPLTLAAGSDATPQTISLQPISTPLAEAPATLRDVLANRAGLQALSAEIPDVGVLTYSGPRAFGAVRALYQLDTEDPNRLLNQQTGEALVPDFTRGFYYRDTAERQAILADVDLLTEIRDGSASVLDLQTLNNLNRTQVQAEFRNLQADLERALREYRVVPGFQVNTGLANYRRIFVEEGMLAPFVKIFTWTVIFASFTVAATYLLGLVLACLLNWKLVKGSVIYRVLMILPYAVPAFISIQIFKGLFNQNFGEINLILEFFFGVKPAWFTDPTLAKVMILITNLWLGYPYMMILGLGMLQSISDDLYEAAYLEGSGIINNFFRITLPLVSKPMIPLLISTFAFNFNNFLLIYLLTKGGPNILGANPLAGETDLLISYAFRLAFGDSTNEYALGAAIGGLIFLLIVALSLFYIRYARVDVAR